MEAVASESRPASLQLDLLQAAEDGKSGIVESVRYAGMVAAWHRRTRPRRPRHRVP